MSTLIGALVDLLNILGKSRLRLCQNENGQEGKLQRSVASVSVWHNTHWTISNLGAGDRIICCRHRLSSDTRGLRRPMLLFVGE